MGGDDDIEGGGGFDFVRFDFATKRIRVDLGQGLATGEGADALTSMEGFVGGPKDDTASGDGKSNVLVRTRRCDDVTERGLGKSCDRLRGPGADDLSRAAWRRRRASQGGPELGLLTIRPGSRGAS